MEEAKEKRIEATLAPRLRCATSRRDRGAHAAMDLLFAGRYTWRGTARIPHSALPATAFPTMANFIAVVDPDATRRRAFLATAAPLLPLLPELRTGDALSGDFAVAWAAGSRAPVDVHSAAASDGTSVTVLWGDALAAAPTGRMAARDIAAAWGAADCAIPDAFDGFFAALHFDAQFGVTMGGDVFGIFPLYYASIGDVLLLGSSPELFRHHPLAPARLDAGGLVGHLLSFGALEGRTLLQGVQRLAPRCALRWSGGTVREIPNYVIPSASSQHAGSLNDQVMMLDEQYAAAVARHAPSGMDIGMLLSGGRDTRLLCGYLGGRAEGMRALTFGRRSDYEVRTASTVARALRMQHAVVALPSDDLPGNGLLQARWEHLGGGFSNVHMWSAIAPLRALPSRVLTGYLRESLDFRLPDSAFDAVFSSTFNRGFVDATLRRLLRAPLRDLIEARSTRMHAMYLATSEQAAERPWRFQLSHYARTHPGGVPWRLSFGAWPVLPILDRTLLNAIASVPLDTVAARAAQDRILRERFPRLARLPLDRNDFDTEPLVPSPLRHRLNHRIVSVRRWAAHVGLTAGERERRYYYRTYDINAQGWRGLRAAAEPHREAVDAIFDMDELRRWLPSPSLHIAQRDSIHDGFRVKTLLGLMLWAAEHPL